MGWAAVDNLHQVKNNKPQVPFEKGRKVFGKWMEEYPGKRGEKDSVTTDFDELLSIRKKKAGKDYIRNKVRGILTALGLSLFLIVFLLTTLGRLG